MLIIITSLTCMHLITCAAYLYYSNKVTKRFTQQEIQAFFNRME